MVVFVPFGYEQIQKMQEFLYILRSIAAGDTIIPHS